MAQVATMSRESKIQEAMRRSLPRLGPDARAQVEAMLSPASLAIIGSTLVVWAGSHFFGIGEIVDIVLLVVGFSLLGVSVLEGAKELMAFAETALGAVDEAELDKAAEHFARAVVILGISTISAILLRKSASSVIKRGAPHIHRMPNIGKPPAPGTPPRVTRPFSLGNGVQGQTDAWGNIAVMRNQSMQQQRLTLLHEWVHRVLSPRVGPLRQIRAQIRLSAYGRSALLQYLEEALAESYAQLRMGGGIRGLLVGIKFPLAEGYVTISQMAGEGIAIGNITIGSAQFTVRVVDKPWPEKE